MISANDPLVTGFVGLLGTAIGAFIHHIGTQTQNKLGTAKTPLAEGELAVAQAVLPGQVAKADKWLVIHAGEIPGAIASAFLNTIAGAIVTAPGANPAIASALGGLEKPQAADTGTTTTTTTQTVSQAAAPAPDPASLDPLPGAGVHPMVETITQPDGSVWQRVAPPTAGPAHAAPGAAANG